MLKKIIAKLASVYRPWRMPQVSGQERAEAERMMQQTREELRAEEQRVAEKEKEQQSVVGEEEATTA